MASKTAKKKSPARRAIDGKRKASWIACVGAKELAAVLPGGIAILLLLSFISYTPEDLPSWVPFSRTSGDSGVGIHNFIGPVGTLIAGYGYFFLGAACYLIPAVLLWWAVQVFTAGKGIHSRNYVAFSIFIVAAACLIDYQKVLFQDWVELYNLPKSAGGFIGHFVGSQLFSRFLGSAGSFLIMATVYLITLIVITGIHPLRFARVVQKRAVFHWKRFRAAESQDLTVPPAKKKPKPASVAQPTRERKIIDASQRSQRLIKDEASQSKFKGYQLPSLEILQYLDEPIEEETDKLALITLQNTIVATLKSFGLDVEPGDITKGPTITRYEVYPAPGLRVNKIMALKADLARATRAQRINILAPIPGKDTVGIEIANSNRVAVPLRELFEDDAFRNSTAKLPLVLGKDVYGETIVADLAKMPHLLVAGATGSGKSVCINSMIASLLYRYPPDELKFIMIDPKVVEMQLYNALPHMVVPVVTDPKKVVLALRWVINEMERRYALFAKNATRNFEGYNALEAGEIENDEPFESLPYIVVIIDELADLMQTAPADVETGIARIAQKARAAGIHLIVATQTPRADVVTGIIKANIPCRIAFQVSSKMDSRIILDENGAENLVGKGDMLYLPPGTARMTRVQGALITDEESGDLINTCAAQGSPNFEAEIEDDGNFGFGDDSGTEAVSDADEEIIQKCLEVIYAEEKASTSLLQRRLRLGYTRAARMIDILENRGIIGPGDGAKPRQILIDLSKE